MKKPEFVKKMAKKAGCTQIEAEIAYDAFVETLTESLVDNDKTTIHGLGVFWTDEVEERERRDPRNGDPVLVPAHIRPKFRWSKSFVSSFRK